MTCVICKQGQLLPGHTTVVVTRGDSTVIVKGAPAQLCDNCGEYYLDEKTAQAVFARADAAVRSGAEVEILRFAA